MMCNNDIDDIDDNDDTLCPICYENNAEYFTECNHKYCIDCLKHLKKCALCNKILLRSLLCQEIKETHIIKLLANEIDVSEVTDYMDFWRSRFSMYSITNMADY